MGFQQKVEILAEFRQSIWQNFDKKHGRVSTKIWRNFSKYYGMLIGGMDAHSAKATIWMHKVRKSKIVHKVEKSTRLDLVIFFVLFGHSFVFFGPS